MSGMLKLIPILLGAVTLVFVVEGVDEITFYQQPVCSGNHYTTNLGNGDCRKVPSWLTEEGWNLSVDPQGHCIKIYENSACRESVAAYGGYSSLATPNDVLKRCKSSKELQFRTIGSFKRVPGPC